MAGALNGVDGIVGGITRAGNDFGHGCKGSPFVRASGTSPQRKKSQAFGNYVAFSSERTLPSATDVRRKRRCVSVDMCRRP